MDTDKQDASCLSGTNETTTFNNYIKKCRTINDTRRSTNFFSESKESIKDTFKTLRAQFDDLLMTGDSVDTMLNLTGSTNGTIEKQIGELTKKKESVLQEIKHYRNISDSADKSFLEDIYNGTPQKELAPSLQDATLLLFWFGWLIFIITLTSVRWFSPSGTWKSGLFTFFLLVLVTLCMYSLLVQIA